MPVKPAILERLRGVQRAGSGWLAFCPVHNDQHKRSLSIGVGDDGKTLLKCHAAGCTAEKITAAVGMSLGDLAGTNGNQPPTRRREVAAYDYVDERGELLSQNVRFEPKDFRQRRPDGHSGWTWNMDGVRRVPYRLPELAEQPRVFIAEGEKDCDALWALGLAATTNAAGAGKWLKPHTAALVAAAIPEIVVLPDNDAPGEKHARAVAESCHAAGLRVKILCLPGLPPKGDVSDWLAAGHTPSELTALAEAAPVFEVTTAPADSDTPDVKREADEVALAWPADALVVRVSNFHDGHDGATAEVLITHGARELHWARLALVSTQARVTLTKKLKEQAPDVDWASRLEHVCRIAADMMRSGEAVVALVPQVHDLTERHALMPLQPRGQTALVYVHGGGGKSLLALLGSIVTITGKAIAGLQPYVTGPVLYLDWESTQDEHETRLALLAHGLGLDAGAVRDRLFYRPMAGRLADDARRLRQDVARLRVVSVIVDSVVPAAGPEAEGSEAAVRLMGVLRSLGPGVSRMMLGHVSKGEATQGGPTYPFGSVFYWNLSRSVWEIRSDDDDREHLRLSLTHKKVNAGPKLPTFGLDFHFQPERITVCTLNLADQPTLTRSASQPERFLLTLHGGPMTTKAMADALDITEAVAGAVGRRLAGQHKVVKVPLVPPDAAGSTFKWALTARRSEPTS